MERKKEIMKREKIATLFILLFLVPLTMVAQEKEKTEFTTGFKAGVQASTYQSTSFNLEGYNYNNKSLNTRIGYTFSTFFRLSKGRPYIQTEGIFSIDKHNFSFEHNETQTEPSVDTGIPKYRLTTYSIKVPLYIGYKFVDSKPYTMGVFTGPKAKFLFTSMSRQQFSNFDFTNAKEYLDPLTYSWVIGLEVGISNLCFDFIYEVGMNNASEYIYIPESDKKFKFNRKLNTLSFSLGVTI